MELVRENFIYRNVLFISCVLMLVVSAVPVIAPEHCLECQSACGHHCYETAGAYNPYCINECVRADCPCGNLTVEAIPGAVYGVIPGITTSNSFEVFAGSRGFEVLGEESYPIRDFTEFKLYMERKSVQPLQQSSGSVGGPHKLGNSYVTQTFVINNSPNSFPMFHNASYVNFTIDNDTINLTLDINASFDGVCNLSNLTGTNISAAGSSAELEYMPVSYQTGTYDYKWKATPYFNESEHKLYLLSGSGNVIFCRLKLEENATSINATIPKVVGVGELVGVFSIETVAQGANSTYNDLNANLKGVGYMNFAAEYAPDTTYERTPFLPELWHCEHLWAAVAANNTQLVVDVNVIGVLNRSAAIEGVAHDWDMTFEFEVEYMPVSYQTGTYNHKWELIPVYKETEQKLYLLNGSGNVIICRLKLEENATSINATIPKVVGVGELVGVFSIETVAQGANSTYNDLNANLKGVGYMDLFAQYAPDTSFAAITFMPTFSHCEAWQGRIISISGSSESRVDSDINMIGVAEGITYLTFNGMPLEGVSLDATFDLDYHLVNIFGNNLDEKWSIKPWQYNDILVILRGTGTVNELNFTFNDTASALPEILSYGYLQGYDNLSAIILPHYLSVLANGSDVAAMDGAGHGGFGVKSYVNLRDPQFNLIDPPLGTDVCMNETTQLTASITINATNPNDTRLENVSVCINVTCAGGYGFNEKQYLNLSGTNSVPITFAITPPAIGQCTVVTCIDCDEAIPEFNESDNCGNTTFMVVDCRYPVPISPFAVLALMGILAVIAVSRIKKQRG